MRQLNAGPADGPPSQIFETRTRSQKSCCTAFLKIKITKGSCGPDERFLRKESFGMPQPAAALSITNMMNPHLFFHPYGSCSPASSSSTSSTWGRRPCHRTRAGDQNRHAGKEGGQREGRGEESSCARTAPGTSAQHAEKDDRSL